MYIGKMTSSSETPGMQQRRVLTTLLSTLMHDAWLAIPCTAFTGFTHVIGISLAGTFHNSCSRGLALLGGDKLKVHRGLSLASQSYVENVLISEWTCRSFTDHLYASFLPLPFPSVLLVVLFTCKQFHVSYLLLF
jgi:hypothetical protein